MSMDPMDPETIAACLKGTTAVLFALIEAHPTPQLLAAKLGEWIERAEMLLSDTPNSDRVIELTKAHVRGFERAARLIAQIPGGSSHPATAHPD